MKDIQSNVIQSLITNKERLDDMFLVKDKTTQMEKATIVKDYIKNMQELGITADTGSQH